MNGLVTRGDLTAGIAAVKAMIGRTKSNMSMATSGGFPYNTIHVHHLIEIISVKEINYFAFTAVCY